MCPACANAREHPLSAKFEAGCESCCARAIASTSMFQGSIEGIAKSPQYRMALAEFFPGNEQRGDRMARDWLQAMKRKERETQ